MKIQDKEIEKKLEYIGLDLEKIPETLKLVENLNFKPNVNIDEKKYKQYRFVSPKEIDILLTPTNRTENIKVKYEKSAPLIVYLEPKNEQDVEKHEVFLNMLREMKIEDIEKIEEEQQAITKKIPFKVRYPKNYLWQMYYSANTERYFMLVPTEEKDYSAFFYALKKQLEKKKPGKVFVPICNAEYSKQLLNKTEIESLENYLWLFTKDWPSIYEVYDKTDTLSLQIVGQTQVFGKIKSEYKVKLSNKIEATKFFKLIKALFILGSELETYFQYTTQIDKQGSLEIYYENRLLQYDELSSWVNEQYRRFVSKERQAVNENYRVKEKLNVLRRETTQLELEYLKKEKQISTFLECKKTFFGKVKYFFKYSGKKSKKKEESESLKQEIEIEDNDIEEVEEIIKRQYTLDEVIQKGKRAYEKETELKRNKMDFNALKLKKVNLIKKIENATAFITEIDNHKKSIFEFWKYSNKDEIQKLAEGDIEEVENNSLSKVFDYEEDIEEFGINMDKIQREIYTKQELDALYLLTTNQIEIINKLKTKSYEPKEIDKYLKEVKADLKKDKDLIEDDNVDIFGGLEENTRKIKKLANKTHREQPKNKYSILEISKSIKDVDYKVALNNQIRIIKKAIEKNKIGQDLSVYKWLEDGENIDLNKFNIFNLNPEKEIEEAITKNDGSKINLYKMNLDKNINGVVFTNSIYYDNQNKTLPIGNDKDTRMIVQLENTDIELVSKRIIKIGRLEDDKEEASKLIVKNINLMEYNIKQQLKETENEEEKYEKEKHEYDEDNDKQSILENTDSEEFDEPEELLNIYKIEDIDED